MDYSLVVPTNARPYCLERLLKSLRHLPAPTWVIVGDSTPPEAPEWVRLWYERLFASPGLRVVRLEPNRGPSGARRDLIARCDTPYVLFLDDDVVATPSSARVFDPLVEGRADIVGGTWLQDKWSDYGRLLEEDQARQLPLDDLPIPEPKVVPVGFMYSFSCADIEPRCVIKTQLTCSAMLDAIVFVDDLVPNIAMKTEILDRVNFDERFLYYFEWYDFYMQAREAGLRCACNTAAKFAHMPEAYAWQAAPHLRPREDDRERFRAKWRVKPLFSGEL